MAAALSSVFRPASDGDCWTERRGDSPLDFSYVVARGLRRVGHQSTQDLAAARMASRMTNAGVPCTAEQMKHRIDSLCSRLFGPPTNRRPIMRVDAQSGEVLVLREWVEWTFAHEPFEILERALRELAHPYLRPDTRLLTVYPSQIPATPFAPAQTLFHLPRVVVLPRTRRPWLLPGDPIVKLNACPEAILATRAGCYESLPACRRARWLGLLTAAELADSPGTYPAKQLRAARERHYIASRGLAVEGPRLSAKRLRELPLAIAAPVLSAPESQRAVEVEAAAKRNRIAEEKLAATEAEAGAAAEPDATAAEIEGDVDEAEPANTAATLAQPSDEGEDGDEDQNEGEGDDGSDEDGDEDEDEGKDDKGSDEEDGDEEDEEDDDF